MIVAIVAHLGPPIEAPPMARAESRVRVGVNGNGSGRGRRRDVARADVGCEDKAREIRGPAGVIFPSYAREGKEGTGGFVVAGSVQLG